jgi:hypothetical protein
MPEAEIVPIEYMLLLDAWVPLKRCPACGVQPFVPFMRGMVHRHRSKWLFFGFGKPRRYCALICSTCKEIIDYESPDDY